MDILKLNYPDPADRLCTLLTLKSGESASLEVGTACLKAGTRMPDRGVSAHPRHEISIILEGEIETTSSDKTVVLGAGDIVSIAAREPQSSIVRQDSRLIYPFFGDPQQ